MISPEQLYQTCFREVYAGLLKLCGDAGRAEELTAETFLQAMEHLDSFRGECSLQSWLLRIARNRYISQLRREKHLDRTVSVEELALPSPEDGPEAQLLHSSEAQQAQQALHHLPEPQKEVFLWRVYGELSFREIGNLFGRSENWACVTFYRAREKLRKELEESS